ncbi:MAG: HEAT repeat domain-containing protein [Halorhabdus sp.]
MPGEDGPPDPRLDPTRSMGVDPDDIEVSRADAALGSGDPADFTAADTDPVADASVEDLLATLTDGDGPARRRAALALADRDPSDPGVYEALAERVRTDDDPEVRQFAIETLGELADATNEGATTAVDDALGDDNPWVRAEAVVALDHLAVEDRADRLEAALDDDHHAVRRNAAIALWKGRGADALPALRALADDESARVREWVAELLGRIDHPDAERALVDLRDDDESIVAKTAARALDGSDSAPAASGRPGSGGTDPRGPGDQPPQL